METIDIESNTQTLLEAQIMIEPTIGKYFLRLNSNDYTAAAELFSGKGSLHPPFGKAVCGRAAIAQYLKSEARGMTACPESIIVSAEDSSNLFYQIKGKVKTGFFTVNVSWTIALNPKKEILGVKVTLLHELQDLLALKQAH